LSNYFAWSDDPNLYGPGHSLGNRGRSAINHFPFFFSKEESGGSEYGTNIGERPLFLPGSTASGEDEQALFQLERDWAEATIKKDMAALDNMLATEFQANYVGLVGNKKQFLSVLKSDTSKTESVVVSEMKAIVFGDRAIVNGLTTEKSITAGKDTSGQYRFTDVFVKREGRWQCVTGYSSKMQ
jgi:ketosteroid isomerase-like protein